MRIVFLIVLLATPQALLAAGKDHSRHGKGAASLVPECLKADALPSPHCGRTPSVAMGQGKQKGVLYVVFSQHGHIYLSKSLDMGQSFAPPIAINPKPEAIYDDGENRPKLLVTENNHVFVSWTHKTPGRYSGDVRFARSLDGGESFSSPVTINTDRELISHRFDALKMDTEGRLHIIWIDKRAQMAAEAANQTYRGASLYYVVSEDLGASFSENKKWIDHSCECCRIATDVDANGNVVALWRQVFPGNIRDHAIATLHPRNNASQISPVRATYDNWELEGCPHHGPDLYVDQQNMAHLAWFTQGNKQTGLLYGQHNLNTATTDIATVITNSPGVSRPQVHAFGKQVSFMWKQFDGQLTQLMVRHSNDQGETWSPERTIAQTQNASDHPDWLFNGSTLYGVWHTQSEGLKIMRVQ